MSSQLPSRSTQSKAIDSFPAIDICQWQMEIDNFIDETGNELNEIVQILEGGPMAHPLNLENAPSAKPAQPAAASDNPSAVKADSDSPGSGDRLADLKQKLASRIEQSRETDG